MTNCKWIVNFNISWIQQYKRQTKKCLFVYVHACLFVLLIFLHLYYQYALKMHSQFLFTYTIKLFQAYLECLTVQNGYFWCFLLSWFRVKNRVLLKCEHWLPIKDVRFDQRGIRFVVEGIRFRQRASTVRPTRGTARGTSG